MPTGSGSNRKQDANESIKASLQQAPVLVLADENKPFSVVGDASDYAIGCALLQKDDEGRERVISFQSRQLKAAERNYPVHDKELLAMKYALVKFRKSGKLNVLADALSRRPDYELAHVSRVTIDLYDRIRLAYQEDENYAPLVQVLSDGKDAKVDKLTPRQRAQLYRYELAEGVKPSGHSSAPLQSLPVPADCWKSMSLDFGFGLPTDDKGNIGILVFVCRLSKMVHLAPNSWKTEDRLWVDCLKAVEIWDLQQPGRGGPKGEEGVDFFIGAEAVLEYYVNCPAPGPAPASVPPPALAATPGLEDAPAPPATGALVATPAAASTTPPPVIPSPLSPQPQPPNDNPAAFTTPVRCSKGKQRLRSNGPARGQLITTSPHEVIDLDLEAVSEEDDDEVDDDDGDEDFVDDDIVGSVSDAGTIESVDESFQPELGKCLYMRSFVMVYADAYADPNADPYADAYVDPYAEYLATRDVMSDRVDDLNLTAPDEDAKDDMFVDDDDADSFTGDVQEIGESIDDDDAEAEVEHEFQFAERFLDDIGGVQEVLTGNLKKEVLKDMAKIGWEDVVQPDTQEYMQTPYEPVVNTWCTNEYRKEMIPQRVDEALRRYKKRHRAHASLPKKTRRDILHDLQNEKTILPHEICRFFGLLIARSIMPDREKLTNHWKPTDEGGIHRGTFGAFLSRDRFQQISRNLHFNPNNHEQAKRDRAWKIRKLVDVQQTTFERGYVAPAYLAFDEAILPSRSSFNKMRVYLKGKPHNWGTKLFMLYSAVTAYRIRFEVYCGKKQHASDAHKPDMKSGPAAVKFYQEGRPLSHVAYMKTLHLRLCQLQASDMYEGNEFGVQPVATAEQPQLLRSSNGESEHTVRQLQRFRNQTTQNERYRYACKVCASLKEGKERAKTSTYYCSQCNKEGPSFCAYARTARFAELQ
ncbi:Hypothetical protein PHPALM_3123 [Phytophthora palmivora]|uniref:PiggyBac transposable element-derived protein domain-containing protein n=1 Tax=Phytophthora palmivora TaxID=4796 RepID=A0A2P4YN82_9STRA|nr:Hypothetical protein PHPALM_3123 [Phytophthora palmivora]